MGAGAFRLPLSGSSPSMFNFSANHLLLLSRTEYRSCVVFVMRDDSTRRVYRLYDFTKSQHHHARPILLRVRERSTAPTNSTWSSSPSSRTPNTRGLPLFLLLLTAREGGLWPNDPWQGKNRPRTAWSLLSGGRRRCVPAQPLDAATGALRDRPKWLPFIPPLTQRTPTYTKTRTLPFPAPATSHPACGFPALGAPVCLVPRVMGPIVPGRLSHLTIDATGIR